MTKRNSEHPRLVMRVGLNKKLEHVVPWGEEMMMHYPLGADVEVHIFQRRSLEHTRLYWAVLHACVDNSENKYGTAEDLHSAIKIALGYTHKVKLIGEGPGTLLLRSAKYCLSQLNILRAPEIPGISKWLDKLAEILFQLEEYVSDSILLPGSIAFDRMDQAEFKVYFDRAMNELRKAGYPVDAYIIEGKKKLAEIKPYYGAKNGRRQTASRGDRDAEKDAA